MNAVCDLWHLIEAAMFGLFEGRFVIMECTIFEKCSII